MILWLSTSLTAKTTFTCQSNYNLTIETPYTKIRYIGKVFSKACLQVLVSVIINIGEIKNKWKTGLTWTKGMFTGYLSSS